MDDYGDKWFYVYGHSCLREKYLYATFKFECRNMLTSILLVVALRRISQFEDKDTNFLTAVK